MRRLSSANVGALTFAATCPVAVLRALMLFSHSETHVERRNDALDGGILNVLYIVCVNGVHIHHMFAATFEQM